MCAQQSLVIKLFLAAMKHYITHNPPARTEDIHGVSQPMPVFCSQDLIGTGFQENDVIPLGQVSKIF